jgi:hypothetical protein
MSDIDLSTTTGIGSLACPEVLICHLQQSVISIHTVLDAGLFVRCDKAVADLNFTRRENYDLLSAPIPNRLA